MWVLTLISKMCNRFDFHHLTYANVAMPNRFACYFQKDWKITKLNGWLKSPQIWMKNESDKISFTIVQPTRFKIESILISFHDNHGERLKTQMSQITLTAIFAITWLFNALGVSQTIAVLVQYSTIHNWWKHGWLKIFVKTSHECENLQPSISLTQLTALLGWIGCLWSYGLAAPIKSQSTSETQIKGRRRACPITSFQSHHMTNFQPIRNKFHV